ncbi:hypothetical protein K27_24125, partial [Klebsiella pneumoniae]
KGTFFTEHEVIICKSIIIKILHTVRRAWISGIVPIRHMASHSILIYNTGIIIYKTSFNVRREI